MVAAQSCVEAGFSTDTASTICLKIIITGHQVEIKGPYLNGDGQRAADPSWIAGSSVLRQQAMKISSLDQLASTEIREEAL